MACELDFDDEAIKMWEEMGLHQGLGAGHNRMDAACNSNAAEVAFSNFPFLQMFQKDSATLYVGGEAAASDLDLLKRAVHTSHLRHLLCFMWRLFDPSVCPQGGYQGGELHEHNSQFPRAPWHSVFLL